MRVRVAYVEEPPFYWTDEDGSATGADVELSRMVLDAIGATAEYQVAAFEDLLIGVAEGRWDMNVPIFITPERALRVEFSLPVWALGDGALVARGNPAGVTSYASVAVRALRLGVIPGQVQIDAARAAGTVEDQLVSFASQSAAVDALIEGRIDAFAATMVGNRAIVHTHPELETVALSSGSSETSPVGAFSFAKDNSALREAVDAQLRAYLGTEDHRARMSIFGLASTEIDPVL